MTERRTLSPEMEQRAQDLIKDMMVFVAEIDTQMKEVAKLGAKFIQSVEGGDVCDIMKPSLELLRISKDLKACANVYWEVFDLDTVEGWDY